MEAAAAYHRPLSTGVVHAACTSSTPQSFSRASSRAMMASLGDANRRRNFGLGSLNLHRTTRVGKTTTVRAEVAPVSSPFKEQEGEKQKQKQSDLYSPDVYDELTVENVDTVLNEVRPYLISDGGNVEVASVADGLVSLRLQASLKGVVQVDQQQTGATVMGVDSHLETLRPAIHNYGGFVQVVSVSPEKGLAVIRYKGPALLASGIQAAIKDAFPDINEVVLLDEHQS